MIRLLWTLHNHQPVGNFDSIFARAYDRAYRPFLDVLKEHPGIRVSLHFSGILLDWLEQHRPEYLHDVRALCEAGRVEILAGAYYEPILPMLRDADREGQIAKLVRRVEELFGTTPRGMWRNAYGSLRWSPPSRVAGSNTWSWMAAISRWWGRRMRSWTVISRRRIRGIA